MKSESAQWLLGFLLIILSQWSLHGVHGGWIDEDTPDDKRVVQSLIDGTDYDLVMSDEFNVPGRTFADGDDPTWTGLDKTDNDASSGGGGSLHFYNSSMITTKDGLLEINTKVDPTEWQYFDPGQDKYSKVTKYFKTGMLQSWNKFCFTGGILEIDLTFPGAHDIGGLWPAVWMLGNLGRATYEASTNNLWPWSYDKCDRKLQHAQAISACDAQNHFGLNPHQGRGATEIDVIEVMSGWSGGLPNTDPPISIPYGDLTLQLAPGVPDNRPYAGQKPRRKSIMIDGGKTELLAQTWYDGLETNGSTSLNPFFYGTYLGETKPQEPVTRTKDEVFQADAVGAMYQLTPEHYKKMHTFRLEWQPGPGGRLDWFTKGIGADAEWVKSFTIKDESLSSLMGSQIPMEPSYLILNTGVSSTWGFPYWVPDWCHRCYDCDDPKCACTFSPGFCNMLKKTRVSFLIDHVRLYQSKNHSAHVGAPHTVGCDPVEFPTREYIKGNQYRYMREPLFGEVDDGPLKSIRNGGGSCETNSDCGGFDIPEVNVDGSETSDASRRENELIGKVDRGSCVSENKSNGIFQESTEVKMCKCNALYTGPNCLVGKKKDDIPGAAELNSRLAVFQHLPLPQLPTALVVVMASLCVGMLIVLGWHVYTKKSEIKRLNEGFMGYETPKISSGFRRPEFKVKSVDLLVTGRSV